MTRYYEIKVSLSKDKKQKIANAFKNKSIVTINLKPENMEGEDSFYFTKRQITKLEKSFKKNKGVNLKLSFAQIKYNAKHGGFLGALLAGARAALPLIGSLAKKVLPKLGLSALGGLAEGLTKKLVGNGLYLSKNGNIAQVETDGKGLFLKSFNNSGLEKYGNGLFLVRNGNVQRGEGLLSNIPLIGPLLKMII